MELSLPQLTNETNEPNVTNVTNETNHQFRRNILFNFRRKHNRHQKERFCCKGLMPCTNGVNPPPGCIPLDQAPENKKLMVKANSDIKTMEMGLYPGSMVSLLQNETKERNLIVKIHDQRYVIPREIAEQIFVKN